MQSSKILLKSLGCAEIQQSGRVLNRELKRNMNAILTHLSLADRHRTRHANVRIRWRRDRHWFLAGVVSLALLGLIVFFVSLASLSMH